MKKIKNALILSGVISILIGFVCISFGTIKNIGALFFGLSYIVLGLYLLNLKEYTSDIFKIKSTIRIIAIICCCLLNFLLAMALFFVINKIEDLEFVMQSSKENQIESLDITPKEQVISKEAKRIDSILKIGTLLVTLSGILFSTSSSNMISDNLKPIFILILSILFFGLSVIFKTTVIIKKSEKTYDILAKLFIIFFVIALGFFETFGVDFSFSGKFSYIMYTLVLLTSGIVFKNIANKYNIRLFNSMSYLSFFLIPYCLLKQISAENNIIYGVYTLIVLISIPLKKSCNYELKTIIKMICGLIIFLLTINIFLDKTGNLELFCLLICFINYIIDIWQEGSVGTQYIIPLPMIIYITKIIDLIMNNNAVYIISPLFLILICLILNVKKTPFRENMFSLLFIVFLINNFALANNNFLLAITFATLIMIYFLLKFKNSDEKHIKSLCFISQIIMAYHINLIATTQINPYLSGEIKNILNNTILITTLIAMILHICQKKMLEEINLFASLHNILLSLLGLITFLHINDYNFIINILLISIIICYSKYFIKSDYNKEIIYVGTSVLAILNLFNLASLINDNVLIIHILSAIIFSILFIINNKNNKLSASYGILALLVVTLTPLVITIEKPLLLFITRIPYAVILFLSTRRLFEVDDNRKTTIETIGLILIAMNYLFYSNIWFGIINGIISIAMILTGIKKEEYESLYYSGIVIMILNIIYQLAEFWTKIPSFVYLLLSGLVLIGYVTLKEMNFMKKIHLKRKEIKKDINVHEKQSNAPYIVIIIFLFIIIYSELIYNVKNTNVIDNNYHENDKNVDNNYDYENDKNIDNNYDYENDKNIDNNYDYENDKNGQKYY